MTLWQLQSQLHAAWCASSTLFTVLVLLKQLLTLVVCLLQTRGGSMTVSGVLQHIWHNEGVPGLFRWGVLPMYSFGLWCRQSLLVELELYLV